ncbi:3-mercaptopyruvate sulfurtransferase [Chelativorans sp. AA-79]|uniref:3-mercaptopyruvate sulfurtransferase n=1 Tax=Chelativorans sp. AA-79 TaxID=3028735 RepID=UPI0023FA1DB3|nr:3-mercaptopyruvate sulfurtransferase [Chelativorans sp. AA-79]WEX07407.1 3-mercaptopyruvate sulfurtransferase [Chelativorans sp. AA-79]
MSDKSPFIVSAGWLEERLDEPGLSIVDGSWYFPGRDARVEYEAAHIPGAVFFDQDLVVNPDSDLPHAVPDPLTFERHVSSMGISRDDTIVVYDGPGLMSAPRVWWMFRSMGAEKVFVLEGGFERWRAEGRPVTSEPTKIAPTAFVPEFDESRVVSFDQMRHIVEKREAQIADARAPGRFAGTEPEPRPGLRSGHMPGAVNIPASSLSENGELLPLDRLRETLEAAGLDLNKPVVTSCGSGVTAAVISLALESLGHKDARLYDGSWSEWGRHEDTPVVKERK